MTNIETLEAAKVLLGTEYARIKAAWDINSAELYRIAAEQRRVIDAILEYRRTHPNEVSRG